mgnify:CR=1 FL=1
MPSIIILISCSITEYTIHDRELQETRKKLSEMENKRKNSGEEAERLRNDLQDAQDNAKTASKEVKDLKGKESGAKEERDVLNTDVQSQTKDNTNSYRKTIRNKSFLPCKLGQKRDPISVPCQGVNFEP